MDLFGNSLSVMTNKVSCQYPILEILDLSQNHTANAKENEWSVDLAFPTQSEIDAGAEKKYEASLWARANEEISFHAKYATVFTLFSGTGVARAANLFLRFGAGSHMAITWQILTPAGEGDTCNSTDTPAGTSAWSDPIPLATGAGDLLPCIFPFRYM